LGGRFPDATLLSHDLLEGAHVRVGVASDIELFDQFPPNYLAYSRRNHRWLRGDWQIFDWVFPSVPSAKIPGGREPNPLSLLNKWKVADNLRRSKTPFVAIIVLGVGWLHSPGAALASSTLVGASLLLPSVLPILSWRPGTGSLRAVGQDLLNGLLRGAINGMLLPHTAAMSLDAISRTLYRKFVSKRHLLEWQTANDNYADSAAREAGFVRRLLGNSAFALASLAAVGALNAAALPAASPFLLGWGVAPIVVRWLSGGQMQPVGHELDRDEKLLLRRLARQTWRYFDDFIGPQTNWLPPDNYQETLNVEIAQRTSPTNIGLWMLSLLSAHDFGYEPLDEVIVRTSATIETIGELERYRGHLLNWYGLQTLEPLRPRYVSTVDSGNLLGCLWAMSQGVQELAHEPLIDASALRGLQDTLALLEEALGAQAPEPMREVVRTLHGLFDDEDLPPLELISRLRARSSRPNS
jgi:cyclic beta-1,2-glucan synthetase